MMGILASKEPLTLTSNKFLQGGTFIYDTGNIGA